MHAVTPGRLPVHRASSERHTVRVGPFRVTDTTYRSALDSPWHHHARNTLSVTLTGSIEDIHRDRAFACPPATVFVKPAGEVHRNRIAREGARVVVIEFEPDAAPLPRAGTEALSRLLVRPDREVADLAWKLARETRRGDDLAELAIEGIVLEIVAAVARMEDSAPVAPPAWVDRARELVHARFREGLRLADVAAELGVGQTELSRGFRRHFHVSLSGYARELRIEWAAARLREGDEPISAIALRAGFSDQSHLTRVFRRRRRVTPGAYRRFHRGGG